jgi:hypothetical protein
MDYFFEPAPSSSNDVTASNVRAARDVSACNITASNVWVSEAVSAADGTALTVGASNVEALNMQVVEAATVSALHAAGDLHACNILASNMWAAQSVAASNLTVSAFADVVSLVASNAAVEAATNSSHGRLFVGQLGDNRRVGGHVQPVRGARVNHQLCDHAGHPGLQLLAAVSVPL